MTNEVKIDATSLLTWHELRERYDAALVEIERLHAALAREQDTVDALHEELRER